MVGRFLGRTLKVSLYGYEDSLRSGTVHGRNAKGIGLPTKMAEGFVGVGHTVGVEFFLDGIAGLGMSIDEFSGEFFGETMILTIASLSGGVNEPTKSEGLLAIVSDRHGDLVAGTTDTPTTDLHLGLDVFQGLIQISKFVGLGLLFDVGEAIVNRSGGNTFAAVFHDAIDQFGDDWTIVFWVG